MTIALGFERYSCPPFEADLIQRGWPAKTRHQMETAWLGNPKALHPGVEPSVSLATARRQGLQQLPVEPTQPASR